MCAAIDASRIFQMGKEPCGGLEAIYSAERMLELKRRQEPSIEDTSLRTYDRSQRAYVEFCESLPVSPNAEPWKDWFLNGFHGPIDDAAKVSHFKNFYEWLAVNGRAVGTSNSAVRNLFLRAHADVAFLELPGIKRAQVLANKTLSTVARNAKNPVPGSLSDRGTEACAGYARTKSER